MKIPFASQYGKEKSPAVGNEWPVNLYYARNPSGQECLYGVPQKELLSTFSAAPVRGMHAIGTTVYVVAGDSLYSFDLAWTPTGRGTLLTNTGPVSFSDNGVFGNQLMLSDGNYGYTLDLTSSSSVITKIADADFFGSMQNAFMDGYTIVLPKDVGYFGISGLYDSTAWDALDYEFADSEPDTANSLAVHNKMVWIGGEQTVDLFFNSGFALFPFQKVQGAYITYGNAAPWSMKALGPHMYWLGRTSKGLVGVVRSTGGVPDITMPPGMVAEIAAMSYVADAYAWCYEHEGHAFYVLTFPTANRTFAFDATTDKWAERKSYGLGRDRAMGYCYVNGWHIVGDSTTGKIYRLGTGTYNENSKPIERIARTYNIRNDGRGMAFPRIEVELETGGTRADPAAEAQAMLRWSDDAGRTWSNEYWRSMGTQGDYGRKVVWRKCGYTERTRKFELKITDDVEVAIMDAYVGAL